MIFKSLPLQFWFELLSFLIALIVIRKLRSSSLFWIFIILFFVVLFEFTGMYMKYVQHNQTAWLYNLLTIIQFPLWVLLFYKNISNHISKKIALSLMIGFLGFSVINLFFIQGFYNFNNYSLITGSGILIFLCCIYLFELLNSDIPVHPLKLPMFWISAGAVFYFTGTFLYFAFYDYLRKFQAETGNQIFTLINLNLIIVLYSCISIGLIMLNFKRAWKLV